MQIHAQEPNVRSLHYQFQTVREEDGVTVFKGGMNDAVHERSLFDAFHPVPTPGPDYSALDEVCGNQNVTRVYICADK
eukprot:6482143-Karenia_brevis.AAC.1